MFVYVLLTTSIGPLFSIGSEILTAVSPRQTMKFHNRNTCVRKKSFPHITRGDIQTSAIWYLVVLYCDQIELKGFGWQVELENEGVNDSHRDVLSIKNSLSRAVKSPLCWHEIQSKANHHSLTFKDYEQAGGKTCDNYIAIVNPDFPKSKKPRTLWIYLFTRFWKNQFYTSQQGRRSQAPPPPAWSGASQL